MVTTDIEEALIMLRKIDPPTGEEIWYYITEDGRWLCTQNPDHHEELCEIFEVVEG
jgi:hypothetical protein